MSGMEDRSRIPSATYRLQFHAGFTFSDAAAIVDYLDALGISDLYASPYFQAAPGSTHGYDVADHNRLNPAVGGEQGFRDLAAALRARNMGQVLDFVPNHMGIGESLNRWWMEVLEDGMDSPYARYFDIDWNSGRAALARRILLPILGDRYGRVLERGELSLFCDNGSFFIRYFETRLPVRPASYPVILRRALPMLDGDRNAALRSVMDSFSSLSEQEDAAGGKAAAKAALAELLAGDPVVADALGRGLCSLCGEAGDARSFDAMHELLELQAYRLSCWRTAAEEINYRRFFDINTLAAIRVEVPEVFEASHQLVFELLARGDVTGLRIDHVDGLWDPREYLRRLQDRHAVLCGHPPGSLSLYLVVEKILDPTREQLPSGWEAHGTTGYEFANQMVQFLVDPAAERRMTRIHGRRTGVTADFADLAYEMKSRTALVSLNSEVAALGRMLDEISEMHRDFRDFTLNTLTLAVREVMACLPVYRTYVTGDGAVSAEDEKVVLRAISAARRRNPEVEKAVFDFLRALLLLRLPDGLTAEQRSAHVHFVMRFQQCSGPVMAKGVEDTAFYVYNRLVALNEVGGNPGMFGITAEEFHRLNAERCGHWPHTLLATSTHDTKRSEDVRMRIAALSELSVPWEQALKRWTKLNRKFLSKSGGRVAPSGSEQYLLYQTLLGAWPLEEMDDAARKSFSERIQAYMLKALKEAKINSSWTEPDEEWERAVCRFTARILENPGFLDDFVPLAGRIAQLGALNALAQLTVKCTAPGVPDFYQGTEIWDFSLVDPDNRRPVDFSRRQDLLASLAAADPRELAADWRSGRIKLYITQRLLALRRRERGFFSQADYVPVATAGALASHVIAFERTLQNRRVLVVAPRLCGIFPGFPIGDVWQNTRLEDVSDRPGMLWRNVFTGQEGVSLSLADLLGEFPVGVFLQNFPEPSRT